MQASPLPAATLEQQSFDATFAPGQIVAARYRVVKTLAERATGAALIADDVHTAERVFLKTFAKPYLSQYRREAAAALELSHPNLLRAIDTASLGAEGGAWIAYPFIKGTSLRDLIYEASVDKKVFLDCIADVLRALAYIHSKGWIHCDIKPDNILRVDHGDSVHCVLVDLGAATPSREARGGRHAIGSPAYTAPERLYDGFDSQSDLYSVGVLCFELATGHLPFVGSVNEIYQGHLSSQPAFSEIADSEIRSIVESLMQKDASKRMRSAAEALAAVIAIRAERESSADATLIGAEFSELAGSASSAVASSTQPCNIPRAIVACGVLSPQSRPAALEICGSRPALALHFGAHVEFVDFKGAALGPAVICASPLVADDHGGFLGVVGETLAQIDTRRGVVARVQGSVGGLRALQQRGNTVAWSDGKRISVIRDGRLICTFKNRTYVGEPVLAFLGDTHITASTSPANQSIVVYCLANSRVQCVIDGFAGPIVGMSAGNEAALAVSLVSHRANTYEITRFDASGERQSILIDRCEDAIVTRSGSVFWVDTTHTLFSCDAQLAPRKLGRLPARVLTFSVSAELRHLAALVAVEGAYRVHIWEMV